MPPSLPLTSSQIVWSNSFRLLLGLCIIFAFVFIYVHYVIASINIPNDELVGHFQQKFKASNTAVHQPPAASTIIQPSSTILNDISPFLTPPTINNKYPNVIISPITSTFKYPLPKISSSAMSLPIVNFNNVIDSRLRDYELKFNIPDYRRSECHERYDFYGDKFKGILMFQYISRSIHHLYITSLDVLL